MKKKNKDTQNGINEEQQSVVSESSAQETNTVASSPAPLNDEELLMIKRSVQEDRKKRRRLTHFDNSDKAKLWRFTKKNKSFAILCAVLAVLIVALLVLGAVFLARKIGARENKSDFTLIFGDGKYTEKSTLTAKYEELMRDGIIYVDMYKIAEYAELTVTGTKTSVKFTSNKDNYLRFENESTEAVINGSRVEIGGVAAVSADKCYVPYDFLTKAIGDSMRFTLDRDTNTIKIARRVRATDKKDVFEPLEILFYTDNFTVLVGIQQVTNEYKYEYPLTSEPYLSAMSPEDPEEYLLLANKQTPLGENYAPSDLVSLKCETASGKTLYLREDAADALYFMMLCMQADGIKDTYVTSAYRSYSYQVDLWNRYVSQHMAEGMTREEAEERALTYSARPGTSEHQTGLCIDFMTTSMTDLDETFEATQAFEWLRDNAHKYGFVLRYPSDKVDVTGYKYEPWHFRFVGREAATEMYLSSLCLEEYLELN